MNKIFTSDRCTAAPEHAHAQCCVEHDWQYWQGGSRRQRAEADREFLACLKGRHGRLRVRLMWAGVRLGGFGLLPTSWRWGYGWSWPRSKPPRLDTSPCTANDQKDEYARIREEAIEADHRARARH